MKKFLLIFLLGAGAGVGGYWFLQQSKTKSQLAEAKDRAMYSVWKVGKSLKEFTDEIKQELTRSGQVVRETASSTRATVSGAAITASLKGKLLIEPGLRSIGVETTDGVVTLSGEAAGHEHIARAMKLALETEGVTRVVSRIQVSTAK